MPYKLLPKLKASEGRFHSSILLTYSLDLDLYSQVIRKRLSRINANNQIVFMDSSSYKKMLEWNTYASKDMGQLFSVTPFFKCYAFHPKMLLLLAKDGGKLIIGSGNATTGGFLKNWELFREFEANEDQPIPSAFISAWQLIEHLHSDLPPSVAYQLTKAKEMSPWLVNNTNSEDAGDLLINSEVRLYDQIIKRITKVPKRIILMSPFWDKKLEVIKQLTQSFPKSNINIIIQSDVVNFDGSKVSALGRNVTWHDFQDPFNRSDDWSYRSDFMHAKMILFELPKEDIVFFGSANMSQSALLKVPPKGNYEIMTTLKLSKGEVVKRLKLAKILSSKSITEKVMNIKWKSESKKDSSSNGFHLISAETVGSKLHVKVIGSLPDESSLQLLNHSLNITYNLPLKLDKAKSIYASLLKIDMSGCRFAKLVSNKLESNIIVISDGALIRASSMPALTAKCEKALDDISRGHVSLDIVDIIDLLVHNIHYNKTSRKLTRKVKQPESDKTVKRKSLVVEGLPELKEKSGAGSHASDLDLLISLFGRGRMSKQTANVEVESEWEDDYDSLLDEEARKDEPEREAEDSRPVGTGKIPNSIDVPTNEAIEKGVRKLTKRLNGAIERLADILDEEHPFNRNDVLRCCGMVKIASALTNKTIESQEGDHIVLLDELTLSEFILEITRLLSGGIKGGLLARCPDETWKNIGRHEVLSALSFLRTANAYAAKFMSDYWDHKDNNSDDGEDELYIGAIYHELVGGRLIMCLEKMKARIDVEGFLKNADVNTSADNIEEMDNYLKSFSGKLAHIERHTKLKKSNESLEEGDYVYSKLFGVTVVDEIRWNRMVLLDFDSNSNYARTFSIKHANFSKIDI